MKQSVVIAGFGGQGVLSMGKILAYAGVVEGYEVSWMPSYGPEMRGGTANVTVILSDSPISSPIVTQFDAAIILNQQALDKFEPLVRPGGLLIYESGSIATAPSRCDITIHPLDALSATVSLGNGRLLNSVILGAFLSVCPLVGRLSVTEALRHTLPSHAQHLLCSNESALSLGSTLLPSSPPRYPPRHLPPRHPGERRDP